MNAFVDSLYRWEDGVPTEVYKPLYPPEGGPLAGFQCMECPSGKRTVTRTKRGMVIHLAVCHGVRLQAQFSFKGEVTATAEVESHRNGQE